MKNASSWQIVWPTLPFTPRTLTANKPLLTPTNTQQLNTQQLTLHKTPNTTKHCTKHPTQNTSHHLHLLTNTTHYPNTWNLHYTKHPSTFASLWLHALNNSTPNTLNTLQPLQTLYTFVHLSQHTKTLHFTLKHFKHFALLTPHKTLQTFNLSTTDIEHFTSH